MHSLNPTLITLLQLGAILAYLGVVWFEYQRIRQDRAPTRRQLVPLGAFAVGLHGLALVPQLVMPDGALNLNIGHALSLFTWFIALVLLIASAWRPVAILGLGVMPAAALVLLGELTFPASEAMPVTIVDNPYLLGHIVLSTSAYALLTLAAAQSVLLWMQDRSLRQKHFSSGFNILPPLQALEEILFQIIWTGFALLSISMLSGIFFSQQIFGKAFLWNHHNVLSTVAWAVFAVLLWGRRQLGWRARTAVKWTLSGYAIILLAYFGVKVVMEVIMG